MNRRAALLVALLVAAGGPAFAANLQPTDDPAASAVWQKVRASLFEGRSIAPAPADMLVLEAPARAIDAAVVPIAIRTKFPQAAGGYVSKLYLIIDANPSPISGIFSFTPDSGRAEIETRVPRCAERRAGPDSRRVRCGPTISGSMIARLSRRCRRIARRPPRCAISSAPTGAARARPSSRGRCGSARPAHGTGTASPRWS